MPDSDFLTLINAQGRLHTEQEFGNIVLKAGDNGEVVRLSDVARLELGAGDYTLRSKLDGKNAVGIGIFQAPGANALEIRDSVIAAMDEVSTHFPDRSEEHTSELQSLMRPSYAVFCLTKKTKT